MPVTALIAPEIDYLPRPERVVSTCMVDDRFERSDIRVNPVTGAIAAGMPLQLQMTVVRDVGSRTVLLPGVLVELSHCDAIGTDARAVQGYQITDDLGEATFTTIYPGWCSGRAVNIRYTLHVPRADGRIDRFSSSLYFPDEVTDRVHARPPYAFKRGQGLLNAHDVTFRGSPSPVVLPLTKRDGGYAADVRIAMQRIP